MKHFEQCALAVTSKFVIWGLISGHAIGIVAWSAAPAYGAQPPTDVVPEVIYNYPPTIGPVVRGEIGTTIQDRESFIGAVELAKRKLADEDKASALQQLVDAFLPTSGGANINPKELAGLTNAIGAVRISHDIFIEKFRTFSLKKDKGYDQATLDATISSLRHYRAAVNKLAHKIGMLPRSGTSAQINAMNASVKETLVLTDLLKKVAIDLNAIRPK